METCFVIQPFDNGDYDARYEQIYEPAIKEAAFRPYRVDRDPAASIPIENIERGIKDSTICFADVSEDNPNVWFEMGLAIAHQKEVCIVCSDKRARFPFDIQHRLVIKYTTGAPSHFADLRNRIVKRIRSIADLLQSRSNLPELIKRVQQQSDDLAEYEISCLGILAGSSQGIFPRYDLRREMAAVGYTDLAANASIRKLEKRGLISVTTASDEREGYEYEAVSLMPGGWDWVEENLAKFVLKRPQV